MAGDFEEGFFQGRSFRVRFQAQWGVACEHGSAIEYRDAVGKELDFLESVRREQQSGVAGLQDVVFEKVAKVGGGDGVQAARGFIEQQHARLMQECAGQAQPLNSSGGERAHLAIESVADSKWFA